MLKFLSYKQKVRKLIALHLAMLLLVINLGFVISTHYCCGKAVKSELSVGAEDLNCGMKEDGITKCKLHKNQTSIDQQQCCKNSYSQIHLDVDFSYKLNQIKHFNSDLFIEVDKCVSYIIGQSKNEKFNVKQLTIPPLLNADIIVNIQNFRI